MATLHLARMVHIYIIFLIQVFAPVCPTWSEWSVWSSCPATCGTRSTKKAYRSCLSGPCPPGAVGVTTTEKTARCGLLDCDCHPWDAWSAWGPCMDRTCSKKRTRTCTNTAGGRCPCLGISSQNVPCVLLPYCCEPPEWNKWKRWSECNSTCLQRRSRVCIPASDYCRNYICPGEDWQEQSCTTQHCCRAKWSDWGAWSRCSGACLREKNRTCIACPYSTCTGHDNRHEEACEDGDCCPAQLSAESTWLSWSNWVLCSATCGQGRTSRQRSCASPKCKCASVTGPRLFDETQTVMCTRGCCVIDAAGAAVQTTGEAAWGSWSSCSVTCGPGVRSRSRGCPDGTMVRQQGECPANTCAEDGLNADGSRYPLMVTLISLGGATVLVLLIVLVVYIVYFKMNKSHQTDDQLGSEPKPLCRCCKTSPRRSEASPPWDNPLGPEEAPPSSLDGSQISSNPSDDVSDRDDVSDGISDRDDVTVASLTSSNVDAI